MYMCASLDVPESMIINLETFWVGENLINDGSEPSPHLMQTPDFITKNFSTFLTTSSAREHARTRVRRGGGVEGGIYRSAAVPHRKQRSRSSTRSGTNSGNNFTPSCECKSTHRCPLCTLVQSDIIANQTF